MRTWTRSRRSPETSSAGTLGASLAARLGWIRFTVDRFVDSAGSSGASHHDPDVPSLLDELARRVEVAENLDAWLRDDVSQ